MTQSRTIKITLGVFSLLASAACGHKGATTPLYSANPFATPILQTVETKDEDETQKENSKKHLPKNISGKAKSK